MSREEKLQGALEAVLAAVAHWEDYGDPIGLCDAIHASYEALGKPDQCPCCDCHVARLPKGDPQAFQEALSKSLSRPGVKEATEKSLQLLERIKARGNQHGS